MMKSFHSLLTISCLVFLIIVVHALVSIPFLSATDLKIKEIAPSNAPTKKVEKIVEIAKNLESTKKDERKKHPFHLSLPHESFYKTVHVAGDFNRWDEFSHLLTLEDDQVWKTTVYVDMGTYEYKFIVNGDIWMLDPNCPRQVSDGFGGENSVFTVGKPYDIHIAYFEDFIPKEDSSNWILKIINLDSDLSDVSHHVDSGYRMERIGEGIWNWNGSLYPGYHTYRIELQYHGKSAYSLDSTNPLFEYHNDTNQSVFIFPSYSSNLIGSQEPLIKDPKLTWSSGITQSFINEKQVLEWEFHWMEEELRQTKTKDTSLPLSKTTVGVSDLTITIDLKTKVDLTKFESFMIALSPAYVLDAKNPAISTLTFEDKEKLGFQNPQALSFIEQWLKRARVDFAYLPQKENPEWIYFGYDLSILGKWAIREKDSFWVIGLLPRRYNQPLEAESLRLRIRFPNGVPQEFLSYTAGWHIPNILLSDLDRDNPMANPIKEKKPVTFYYIGDADSVSVVGSFNEWDSQVSPLRMLPQKKDQPTIWKTLLYLEPNYYSYLLHVDQEFIQDPLQVKTTPWKAQTKLLPSNSFLEVGYTNEILAPQMTKTEGNLKTNPIQLTVQPKTTHAISPYITGIHFDGNPLLFRSTFFKEALQDLGLRSIKIPLRVQKDAVQFDYALPCPQPNLMETLAFLIEHNIKPALEFDVQPIESQTSAQDAYKNDAVVKKGKAKDSTMETTSETLKKIHQAVKSMQEDLHHTFDWISFKHIDQPDSLSSLFQPISIISSTLEDTKEHFNPVQGIHPELNRARRYFSLQAIENLTNPNPKTNTSGWTRWDEGLWKLENNDLLSNYGYLRVENALYKAEIFGALIQHNIAWSFMAGFTESFGPSLNYNATLRYPSYYVLREFNQDWGTSWIPVEMYPIPKDAFEPLFISSKDHLPTHQLPILSAFASIDDHRGYLILINHSMDHHYWVTVPNWGSGYLFESATVYYSDGIDETRFLVTEIQPNASKGIESPKKIPALSFSKWIWKKQPNIER